METAQRSGATSPMVFALSRSDVDLDAVRERVGNDERLVRFVVRSFLAEAPRLLEQLREAAETHAIDELHTLAHSLKGIAANVSAHSVRQAAQQLEEDARRARVDHAEQRIDDLAMRVRRAAWFLEQSAH